MTRSPSSSYTRWLLPAIVLVYLILATLYAVYTPDWQAPDEPAHYNYVKYLGEQYRFPLLKPGDYPATYLEEIKEARFPPEMSIAPIRYEFHQPPLYYVLAVPVYRLFGGALLPLRLLSVVLGGLLLMVVNWTVRALIPERPFLALGATAFVAFLPMHLAMTAAVNNDTLAELLLATSAGSAQEPDVPEPPSAGFGLDTKLKDLLADEGAKAVLLKHLSELADSPRLKLAMGLTLPQIAGFVPGKLTPEVLAAIQADLKKL